MWDETEPALESVINNLSTYLHHCVILELSTTLIASSCGCACHFPCLCAAFSKKQRADLGLKASPCLDDRSCH